LSSRAQQELRSGIAPVSVRGPAVGAERVRPLVGPCGAAVAIPPVAVVKSPTTSTMEPNAKTERRVVAGRGPVR